jgi:ribosomal protein S3
VNIKWYTDQDAHVAYLKMREELKPFTDRVFPSLELSHVGINRNEATGEVIVRLHLNKHGSIERQFKSELLKLRDLDAR